MNENKNSSDGNHITQTHCLELLSEIKRMCPRVKVLESYYVADGLKAIVKDIHDKQKYIFFIKPLYEKDEEKKIFVNVSRLNERIPI